jgi:hypothetical protein
MSAPVNFWVRGNIIDLAACGVIAALTILEYKYQVVTRLRKLEGFNYLYIMFSVGLFIGWMIDTFGLDLFKFSGNILLYRVFGVFDVGHYLVWVSIFFILLRYAGVKDMIIGWMNVALFVSIHEGIWYLTYFVAYPQNFDVTVWFYSPFLLLLVLIIPGWYVIVPKNESDIMPILSDQEKSDLRKAWNSKLNRKTFGPKLEFALRRIWRATPRAEKVPWNAIVVAIAITAIFHLMWYLMGFPLTIDNIYGRGALYFDPVTNGLEDMSWVMPTIGYVLASGWYRKRKANSDQEVTLGVMTPNTRDFSSSSIRSFAIRLLTRLNPIT